MTGYPTFNSTAAAKDKFRRCRTPKWFILENSTENPKCKVCNAPLNEMPPKHPDLSQGHTSNRCIYQPKTKEVVHMHYVCAFETTMEAVFAKDH